MCLGCHGEPRFMSSRGERWAPTVDGGISDQTGRLWREGGADKLISGSRLCRAEDQARGAALIRGDA